MVNRREESTLFVIIIVIIIGKNEQNLKHRHETKNQVKLVDSFTSYSRHRGMIEKFRTKDIRQEEITQNKRHETLREKLIIFEAYSRENT